MAFRSGPRSGGSSGGFRSGGFRRFPREMTKIKCSNCGKDAEVPFKPREGSPVYCRECFMKMKGIKPREEKEESTESDESEESNKSEETDESEEEVE